MCGQVVFQVAEKWWNIIELISFNSRQKHLFAFSWCTINCLSFLRADFCIRDLQPYRLIYCSFHLFPSFPWGQLQDLVYKTLSMFRIESPRKIQNNVDSGNISIYTLCFSRCHVSHLAAECLRRTSDPSSLPWTISESARHSALAFAADSQSSCVFSFFNWLDPIRSN